METIIKMKIKQARFYYLDDTTWHSVPARTHPNSSLLIYSTAIMKNVMHWGVIAIGGVAGLLRGFPA